MLSIYRGAKVRTSVNQHIKTAIPTQRANRTIVSKPWLTRHPLRVEPMCRYHPPICQHPMLCYSPRLTDRRRDGGRRAAVPAFSSERQDLIHRDQQPAVTGGSPSDVLIPWCWHKRSPLSASPTARSDFTTTGMGSKSKQKSERVNQHE